MILCLSNLIPTLLNLLLVRGLTLGTEMTLNRATQANSRLSELSTLEIASAHKEKIPVVVAGFLTELSAAMGREIDGILGYSFWSDYLLTIDYPNKRISFREL